MRPMFISTVDQTATSQNSHVGLRLLDRKVRRDLRRRMLTMVTLHKKKHGLEIKPLLLMSRWMVTMATYKVPMKNMRPTPTFFFHPRLRFLNRHRGNASIHRSRAILMAAFAHAIELISKQRPACSPSHMTQK